MTATPHSLVVICPAADRDQVLAVAEAMGVAAGLDVPLSATGNEPATHYAARAWATPVFVGFMTGAMTPTMAGVTAEQIKAALANVVVDEVAAPPGFSARDHFLSVCQSVGLQRIMTPIVEG